MRTPFDISAASEIFHAVIAYIFKVQCIEAMVIAVLNRAKALKKQNRRVGHKNRSERRMHFRMNFKRSEFGLAELPVLALS